MALDVHAYENGKAGKLLFQIDDALCAALDPAFERFRQRTGIFIDPYRDTLFTSGLSTLINAVADSIGQQAGDEESGQVAFLSLLKDLEEAGSHIIFLGD